MATFSEKSRKEKLEGRRRKEKLSAWIFCFFDVKILDKWFLILFLYNDFIIVQ